MRAQSRAVFFLTLLLSLSLVACFGGHGKGGGGGNGGGGGGGNGGGGGGTGAGTVTIIEPAVQGAQVAAGSTLDFEAKVKGGNGTGVTWGVQSGDSSTSNNGMSNLGVVGGSAQVGTMPTTTNNQAVATYAAPSVNALGGNPFIIVTITALQSPATTGPCLVVFVVPTTNSLLSGNFIFELRGFSGASGLPFGIIGRLTSDGAGNIQNGFEDVNIAEANVSSAPFAKVPFMGSYNMDSSRHGTMTLTVTNPLPAGWTTAPNPPPTTMHFSFTLSLDGTFGSLIETDGGASPAYVGSGDFQVQGPSKNFSTARIVGFYILSLSGTAGVGAAAVQKGIVGRLDLTAVTTTTGKIAPTSICDDQNGLQPQMPTGAYTIDDTTSGHGSFNGIINLRSPTTVINFYIGGPGRFYALRMDSTASNEAILIGVVRIMLSAGPFNNTSLGSALFQMRGITTNGHASAIVGTYVSTPGSNSSGSLSGIFDLNDGGSVPGTQPVTFGAGTFGIDVPGTGRGVINITPPGGNVTYNFVFYLRNTGIGFLQEVPASDNSNRGRSGSFFPQNLGPGGDGTYAAATEVTTAATQNGLGVLSVTSSKQSGNFAGPGYTSMLGSPLQNPNIAGTFNLTDTTNSRGTIAANVGSSIFNNVTGAFYLSTNSELIVIGTDGNNQEPQVIFLDE